MTATAQLRNGKTAPHVVMLLSNCFDPDPRVHNEARTLVELGYRVTIVAWDRERIRPASETIDGIQVERVFARSTHGRGFMQMFVMPKVFFLMIKKALSLDFDAVHAHDFDTLPAARLLGWFKRKPVVYDSHEDYAGMLHGSLPGWLEKLIRWTETRLIRRVDLLLTVGEGLRKQFEIRGCRNAQVLGNWKPVEEFHFPQPVHSQVRAQLGATPGSLLVLYISNLGKERHVEELLEAASQRPAVHVVVGGSGPGAAVAQQYAARHSNIRYLGFVQQPDIPRYTAACDVVYYGFDVTSPNAQYSAPNKLFEALAAGRPLLTAQFGEIGRIVSETGCGVILRDYSVAEILRGLDRCQDAALMESMKAHAARAGQQEYNWDRARQVLLAAYAKLIPRQTADEHPQVHEVAAR
ncbi:MAG: glycosyltransferase family 4 protein [Terriglobales bacterium]